MFHYTGIAIVMLLPSACEYKLVGLLFSESIHPKELFNRLLIT